MIPGKISNSRKPQKKMLLFQQLTSNSDRFMNITVLKENWLEKQREIDSAIPQSSAV